MPSFHIEVKGTASPKLENSKLKKWIEQIYRDKESDSIPVIFHKANNHPWVCIFRSDEATFLLETATTIWPCLEESFDPVLQLSKLQKFKRLGTVLSLEEPPSWIDCTGFVVSEDVVVVAAFAEDLLSRMLLHENRAKDN